MHYFPAYMFWHWRKKHINKKHKCVDILLSLSMEFWVAVYLVYQTVYLKPGISIKSSMDQYKSSDEHLVSPVKLFHVLMYKWTPVFACIFSFTWQAYIFVPLTMKILFHHSWRNESITAQKCLSGISLEPVLSLKSMDDSISLHCSPYHYHHYVQFMFSLCE